MMMKLLIVIPGVVRIATAVAGSTAWSPAGALGNATGSDRPGWPAVSKATGNVVPRDNRPPRVPSGPFAG
jgi:hypothetical protein